MANRDNSEISMMTRNVDEQEKRPAGNSWLEQQRAAYAEKENRPNPSLYISTETSKGVAGMDKAEGKEQAKDEKGDKVKMSELVDAMKEGVKEVGTNHLGPNDAARVNYQKRAANSSLEGARRETTKEDKSMPMDKAQELVGREIKVSRDKDGGVKAAMPNYGDARQSEGAANEWKNAARAVEKEAKQMSQGKTAEKAATKSRDTGR